MEWTRRKECGSEVRLDDADRRLISDGEIRKRSDTPDREIGTAVQALITNSECKIPRFGGDDLGNGGWIVPDCIESRGTRVRPIAPRTEIVAVCSNVHLEL
jgi:hypothetical protein